MEVFNREDEWLVSTVVQHEMPQERKGADFALLRAETCQQLAVHRHVEELEQQGCVVLGHEVGVLEIPMDFGCVALYPVGLGEATPLTEQVTHRQIGCGAAVGEAVPFPIRHRLPHQAPAPLRQQPGLPYARLPRNTQHLAMPLRYMRQACVQKGEIPLAPHKGTPVTGPQARHSCPPLCEVLHRVHGPRPPRPAESRRVEGHGPDLLLHQRLRRRTQEYRPGWRQALQLAGLVQGVPHSRIELLWRMRKMADDHRPRVHPHPHRMDFTQGLGTQLLAQLKGRQHRASGMVLLPHRGAKQGRKALSSDRRDGALVTLDHLLSPREHCLHQTVHKLWTVVHCQRGRVRDGTAQDGHELVFLLEGWPPGRRRWGFRFREGRARCAPQRFRSRRADERRRVGHRHRRDEPIPPPMHRLNEVRVLDRIVQGGPDLSNTPAYDRLADGRWAPDRVEQRVLRGQLTRSGNQIPQHGKRLGSERQGLRIAPELLVVHVQPKGWEEKNRGLSGNFRGTQLPDFLSK